MNREMGSEEMFPGGRMEEVRNETPMVGAERDEVQLRLVIEDRKLKVSRKVVIADQRNSAVL